MKYYSVPADFKKQTLHEYTRLNSLYEDSRVVETYGQVTISNFIESGRSVDMLPAIDIVDLADYIEYSKKMGIHFNYTLNAPNLGNKEFSPEWIHKFINFLDSLYQAGVRSLTITLPSLLELVKGLSYDFEIKASTICQITNVNKAMSYKKLGVDRIVADESLNRDFHTLKKIRNTFGERVELIANTVCFKECVYRMFHYNQIAGDSIQVTNDTSTQYYSHRCVMKRYEDIGNMMRMGWIRPEDIKYYSEIGINYFKLQGRQSVLKGDPVRAVESYFKQSYEGNLLDLLELFSQVSKPKIFIDNKKLDGFIKPFFENNEFCKHSCTECNYCDSFAKISIDYEKAREIISLSEDYCNSFDKFKNILSEIKKEQASERKEDMGIDFDL